MSRPEPLVPAECSMAGNDWFPFHFDRLRKSKWWRRASDVARARNVMMWGEAFKAAPAGSLPDDDDELAEAAGYGMDVDAFLAAKAEIMAPWTLCSDGRWYHPTVCEVVLDAWERTSDRRKAAAERQRRRRERVRDVTPPTDPITPTTGDVTHQETGVTRDNPERGRDFGIQDRTGQTVQTEPPLPPDGGERSSISLEAEEPTPRRSAKVRIPDDFPDAAAIAEQQAKARAAGKNLDLTYQAERFRGWAIAKDQRFSSWPQAWRNWAGRAIHEAPAAAFSISTARAADDPDGLWRRRVDAFRRNAYWNRLEWGPAPGKPGCQIAPEMLREFGVEPAPPQPVGSAA